MGQPVPKSHLVYYREDWLVRNLWLARLVTDAYVRLRYPPVFVPDPTEKLVGKIRSFVEGNGAKFLVAMNVRDDHLIRYLELNGISFTSLDGAAFYPSKRVGGHWTPEGQAFVSERIFDLLAENEIVRQSEISNHEAN